MSSFREELVNQMSSLSMAAFGLVAALAWNGAIQSIFKKVFGTADTVYAQIIYAVAVTIVAVAVTMWIARGKEHIHAKIIARQDDTGGV